MLNKIKDKIIMASIVAPAYAAEKINLSPKSGSGFSNLTNLKVESMVSTAISLLMLVVALVFFFILILGGLKWITSEGEDKKVAAARAQITNGLIGLAIVFASWAIIKLIETIFGISILDLTIPTI